MIPFRLYTAICGGSGVLLAAYLLLRRKPKGADEIERERRAWLDRVGRITDGTVIDVQQINPEGRKPATFLIFQYDVAGVSYEASQDVTYLRQLINLHSCRLGLPTSDVTIRTIREIPLCFLSAGWGCGNSQPASRTPGIRPRITGSFELRQSQ